MCPLDAVTTGHGASVDLRTRLERALGWSVEQGLWKILDLEGHTSVRDTADFRNLVAKARAYRRLIPSPSSTRRRAAGAKTKTLEEWQEKTGALARYRASQASALPAVIDFRRTVLRDVLLSSDDARGFIRRRLKRRRRQPRGHADNVPLAYAGEQAVERAAVPRASVLGRLSALAVTLAKTYRWEPYAATWFVVTGQAPITWPLQIDDVYDENERLVAIRLVVAPWMPPYAVAQAFAEIQTKVTTMSSRPPSDRRLALALFAVQAPAGSSVRELLAGWNRQRPAWAYGNVRNFVRDLKAARRQIDASDFQLDGARS